MNRSAVGIGFASIALAALGFLAAAGSARGPVAALGQFSPLPIDGASTARQSSVLLATAESALQKGEKIATLRPRIDEARALARRAYMREPLAVESLRNVSIADDRLARRANQQVLMVLASKFTRRDTGVDFWLAQYHGRRGDVAATLKWLDYALTTSTTASEVMMPRLVQVVQDPQSIEPLSQLLGRDPVWAQEFWDSIAEAKTSYVNVARIRRALYQHGRRLDRRHDEMLMLLLVREGSFAQAEALASAMPTPAISRQRDASELVTEGDFAGATSLPPFGWELIGGSQIDVYRDAAKGTLHIGSYGEWGGTVARQLVKLPKGPIQVRAAFKDWNAQANGAIFASIKCAELNDGSPPVIIELTGPRVSQSVNGGDCSYYWLGINVRAREDRQPVDADLDAISLTVGRARSKAGIVVQRTIAEV